MENFLHHLNTVNKYRIKLLSDVELEKNASIIIDIAKSNKENYTQLLESTLFGFYRGEPCEICGNKEECTCHFGLIKLPYPIIVNTVILDKFFKVIDVLCPVCGCIPLDNLSYLMDLKPEDRFGVVRKEILKVKKEINHCPHCNNDFIYISTENDFPSVKFLFVQTHVNKSIQISPEYIYTLLNHITDETIQYLGFNIETDNPRNYMTKYITVIPNRLRIKTLDSQSSNITSAYKNIIEQVLKDMYKIKCANNSQIIPNELCDQFNKLYTNLNARYVLIIDMTRETLTNACLTVLSKRDRQHVEESASLMGRLKHKETSYFMKGIVAMRHKVSCRTVLGPGNAINSNEIGLPYKYCSKLGQFIPIYEENIDFVKQIVASMEKHDKHDYKSLRVNKVYFSKQNSLVSVKPNNAVMLAAKLQPGDKVYTSLLPKSIIQHIRYPALREESFASHILIPTNHTCMTIPLAACDYKNADFDGDETNLYIPNSQLTDNECLLLSSIYKQLIEYGFGTIGVMFQGYDTKVEIPMMKKKVKIGVKTIYDDNGTVIRRERYYNSKTVGESLTEFMDYITGNSKDSEFDKIPKINYEDSKTKVVNNVIDEKLDNINNQDFFKYLYFNFGPERTLKLIDLIIQLGYNLSYDRIITMGNEIRYYTKETKDKILKIHDETYEEAKKVESSNKSRLERDKEVYIISNKEKSPIIDLLKEGCKGTNIEKIGLSKKTTPYYNLVVSLDSALVEGNRVQPTLNNFTRTCASYHQHSMDPMAYGFGRHGYMSNKVTMSETFFDCMMQRKALYTKGMSVADQGYLQKRFVMAFGPSITDGSGAQLFNNHLVSLSYGILSLDPRCVIKQPLHDIDLPRDEFKNKYSSELLSLYDSIKEAELFYNNVSCYTERKPYENTFMSPYDYEQYLSHQNLTKGKTDKKLFDEFMENIRNIFVPKGITHRYALNNLVQFEYYLRQKAETYNLSREILLDMYYNFVKNLVNTGETVGLKATLCVGNRLTQEALDAIHNATGGSVETNKLKVQKSLSRFEELLGGAVEKNSVITIGFYKSDEETVKKFAKEQETIYLCDIWSKLETVVSNNVNENIRLIHPTIDFKKLQLSKTCIKMVLELNTLANYDVKLSDVYDRLYKSFGCIAFITGTVINHNEFLAYIYFKANTPGIEIDNFIHTIKLRTDKSIVHGNILINCYATQNKNTGDWFIKCNEVDPNVRAYEKILYYDNVDPAKTHTSNTHLTLSVYGVFETAPRLVEEMIYCATELSRVGELTPRHFKTIGMGCICTGGYFAAIANSALKSDIDYLRGCNFEQPGAFLKKGIEDGEFIESSDAISAAFFGDLPKLGSGYSKVMVYKK